MRKFLTVLLLFSSAIIKAQVVNIPDQVFLRNLISAGVDINADGQIQQSEALTVTYLHLACYSLCTGCQYQPVSDLTGIQAFINLQTLMIESDCSGSTFEGINYLNLSGLSNLKNVSVLDDAPLRKINLAGCTGLETLSISISSDANSGGTPDTIDLRSCTNINYVYLKDVVFNVLNAENCANLRKLEFLGTNYNGILQTINIHNAVNLEYFIAPASFGWLNIDFSNLPRLRRINIDPYELADANFTGCTSLDTVDIGWNTYTKSILDFSTCPRLKHLNIGFWSSGSSLKFLNIKNGSSLNTFTTPTNYGTFTTVCADDFEAASIRTYLAAHNNPTTHVYSYCSFYPGGNYNTITGKLRINDNNNGCDNSDRQLVNIPVKFTDTTGQSVTVFSNNTGDYSVYTYKGLFSFAPYLPYPYFTINPANPVVSFDTANSLVNTTNFCLQPDGVHNDLEINFLPGRASRPGFNATYILTYKNRGNTTLSGSATLNFDNSKMNFINASVPVTIQNTGQLVWDYNNLLPLETKTMYVTFYLLPPPINNINDTIYYLATITPSANDETAFDNSFILPQRLTGSYDPNDKQCLEGSKLDISKIGDYIHYQIRFQNEGTDTAFNVVVADTLSDKLDWSTFEFTAGSNTCNAKLTNNKAEFFFPDINLPHKAIDEPGSNGWVSFKIKPKPSVVIGDSLNNSAAIYFDFNLPVITNTATTIVTSSSTPVPVKLEYFSVNKKENTNQLNWKASCTYGNATFAIERSDDGNHFTSIGNISATALRCQLPFNFIDNNPVAGKNYYRLKITDADGVSFYSKVLVVGNNKAGIEITAVANNIIYLNSNKQQTVIMKVVTADGRIIYSGNKTINTGNSNVNLSVKEASGVYTLIIYTMDGNAVIRKYVK
ncbi:MAG: hypothetical protein V4685_11780 [Bacteroidota bacterium]